MNKEEWIKRMLQHPEWGYVGIEWEAVGEIKKLIEKETPLEPINTSTEIWCRNCKEILDNNVWEYCPYCGQKIDWGNDVNKYQEALKLACKYFDDNDCPYTHGLDFKGCLKDDCQDEYSLCWQRYFLEKAEENNKKGDFIDE